MYIYRCTFAGCSKTVMVSHYFVGACLVVKVKCTSLHTTEWMSSPLHNNAKNHAIPAINLLFASAVLVSGNNFEKVNQLINYVGLRAISHSSFYLYQRLYICPAIDCFSARKQGVVVDSLRSKSNPLFWQVHKLLLHSSRMVII